MKKHLSNIMLVLILLIGLSLMLYPTFADWWNSMHQSRAIAGYSETVSSIDTSVYDQIWADAREYNEMLLTKVNPLYMDEEEMTWYESLLNVSGNGVMGSLEIEKLDVKMPIYHTTRESVLQIAVGHIEGTSLPTGGAGTHCALSGHRGLPSARLFTDLDKLQIGDTFEMHILNETLTYQIDQILVVLPSDTSALAIDPEQDYCTLVTCTPYGINSHRLLVRGVRIETIPDRAPVVIRSEAEFVDKWLVAPFVAAPIVLYWLICAMKPKKKK